MSANNVFRILSKVFNIMDMSQHKILDKTCGCTCLPISPPWVIDVSGLSIDSELTVISDVKDLELVTLNPRVNLSVHQWILYGSVRDGSFLVQLKLGILLIYVLRVRTDQRN